MKVFSSPGYLIANARVEVKVVYSGFLFLAAVGLATMAVLQVGRIGLSAEAIATHFRGGDYGGEMRFARTFGELVEVTHFHAFTMGAVYLILAHLFVATTIRPWLRWAVIVGTLLGLIGDLAAMWLVRYVAPGFAVLAQLSWGAEWIGLVAMIGVPLVQLWGTPVPDDEEEDDAAGTAPR